MSSSKPSTVESKRGMNQSYTVLHCGMRIEQTSTLRPEQSSAVAAVASRAAAHDGLDALSEQTLIRIHSTRRGPWLHWLAWDGSRLVGYAFLDGLLEPESMPVAEPAETFTETSAEEPGPGEADTPPPAGTNPPTVELVVDPEHRRRGVGRALLGAVLTDYPSARVWAHGNLPAATSLAATYGLRPVRDLWFMTAELTADGPSTPLPEGFTVRSFTADDTDAFLAVNARAFANHPEQGRLTSTDVHERMTQPWFDPAGFLLVHDEQPGAARLAAFHWTKVEHGVGEIYVLGIDPAYQGRGLAAAITSLGLRHLADRGARQVVLYVEGDNHPAVATYTAAGFTHAGSHVVYARD